MPGIAPVIGLDHYGIAKHFGLLVTATGYKVTKRRVGSRIRSQGMSGQSWHEITVSRESRRATTASPTKADGFDEAADGRLLTQTV